MKMMKSVFFLLIVTLLAPIVLHTDTLGVYSSSSSKNEFLEDVSTFESSTSLKQEPLHVVYEENPVESGSNFLDSSSRISRQLTEESTDENPIRLVVDSEATSENVSEKKEPKIALETNGKNSSKAKAKKKNEKAGSSDAFVHHLNDQLIRARVYLSLLATRNNAHFIRELRARVKEITKVLGEATSDSQLPKNAKSKSKDMEQALLKGKQIQDDCAAVVKKLRAMLHLVDDQLEVHRKQTSFLTHLTAKTVPKGLHCLPLRLSSEYFTSKSSQKDFLNKEKLDDPKLYHYALFSDNILAAAVVVNSTIAHAKDPSKHVFHIVTDRFNHAAMKMWFLSNPPDKATIHIQNVDDFKWLNSSYKGHHSESDPTSKFQNPKYLSIMNHLRFYLPEIFPKLRKVLFLDDDIVVQKDLTDLWSLDLKGKVAGVVETCGESFHRFDQYLNFSNPLISRNFDPHACGWAFGMNVFDLDEWKKQNITGVYHKWQNLNRDRLLWKLGSLPPGLITFWDRTYVLDKSWHVLGLGYNPNVPEKDIEGAAVIHYNGNLKPWLEIGIPKFRSLWQKFVDYDHQYLRECNIAQ